MDHKPNAFEADKIPQFITDQVFHGSRVGDKINGSWIKKTGRGSKKLVGGKKTGSRFKKRVAVKKQIAGQKTGRE